MIYSTKMDSAHYQPVIRPHWSECLTDLRARLTGLPMMLVASDFDGTLSTLVDHPAEAVLEPGAVQVLEELAGLNQRLRLAVLSGRRLADLVGRLPFDLTHVLLAGNHGLEILADGVSWLHPASTAARPHLEQLAECLRQRLGHLVGCELEDKGASLSLHYRRLPDADHTALRATVEALQLPRELRRHAGKLVFEFRPRVEWHKGYAIRRIIRQLGLPDSAVIYLGDDLTDEDVFRSLESTATTIHVGFATNRSAARFAARDPADVVEFLKAVATILSA